MFKMLLRFILTLVKQVFFTRRIPVLFFVILKCLVFNINLSSALIDSFLVSIKPKDIWLPEKIEDLSVEILDVKLKLTWSAPTENEGLPTRAPVAGYYVAYSTVSPLLFVDNLDSWWSYSYKITLNYASNPDEKETFVPSVPFKNNTTYYFAIKSYDDASPPNVSPISNVVSVFTRFNDNTIPAEVLGVNGKLSPDRKKLTITWSKVLKNTDGSDCTDIVEYRIYRSVSFDGEYVLRGIVSVSTESLLWEEPEDMRNKVYFYHIAAVDAFFNESPKYMILRSAENVNVIVISAEDEYTNIVIGAEAKNILYKDTNKYGDDIKIELNRAKYEENEKILKSYSLVAKKGKDNSLIEDFVFDELIKIVFNLVDLNGNFVNNGSSIRDMSIYWFNGLEWIKLGGEVEPYFKTISVNTKRLGKYKVKLSNRAESFEIIAIQPDKTFTPNNDGWNDFFEIVYENPKEATVVGKIYDIKGRFVADMKKGPTDNTLIWDGNDYNIRAVEAGIYIYRIELSGTERKAITGSCVVAR